MDKSNRDSYSDAYLRHMGIYINDKIKVKKISAPDRQPKAVYRLSIVNTRGSRSIDQKLKALPPDLFSHRSIRRMSLPCRPRLKLPR